MQSFEAKILEKDMALQVQSQQEAWPSRAQNI